MENVKWNNPIVSFKTRDTAVIPSRSSRAYYVRVRNTEIVEGYIPRINVHEGVVVFNTKGVAYMRAFSTIGQDVELAIKLVTLDFFELYNPNPEGQGPHRTLGDGNNSKKSDVNSWDRLSVEKLTHDERVRTAKVDLADANEGIKNKIPVWTRPSQ